MQQTLEEAFSMILRQSIEITGCGRTDAGVHARAYYAHFDAREVGQSLADFSKLVYQVNAVLPVDISVLKCMPIHSDFHARFDAIQRTYQYDIHFIKDPFLYDRSFFIHNPAALNLDAMHAVAELITHYDEFLSFCKTGSGHQNYKCTILKSEWEIKEQHCVYTISANRFLRGMVRLIVGACLNAGYGKLSLESIRDCISKQVPLPIQLSVPAQGLCFQSVQYPHQPAG